MSHSFAILMAGTVKLDSGDSTHFNIIENSSSEGAAFLLRTYDAKFLLVTGGGNHKGYTGFQIDSVPTMYHDQTGRKFKNQFKVVAQGAISIETLKDFKSISGKKVVPFGVFK